MARFSIVCEKGKSTVTLHYEDYNISNSASNEWKSRQFCKTSQEKN